MKKPKSSFPKKRVFDCPKQPVVTSNPCNSWRYSLPDSWDLAKHSLFSSSIGRARKTQNMMKDIFKENGALVLAEGVGSANDDWLLCRRPLRRGYIKKNKHRQNDPKKVGRGQRKSKGKATQSRLNQPKWKRRFALFGLALANLSENVECFTGLMGSPKSLNAGNWRGSYQEHSKKPPKAKARWERRNLFPTDLKVKVRWPEKERDVRQMRGNSFAYSAK